MSSLVATEIFLFVGPNEEIPLSHHFVRVTTNQIGRHFLTCEPKRTITIPPVRRQISESHCLIALSLFSLHHVSGYRRWI